MKNKDPRDLGYYMPGEWYSHEACWMAWPARVHLWPNIEATKQAYADVANTIAEFEQLKLIVKPSMLEDAKKYTSENGKILPSRITSISMKKQRALSNAVKRARILALI